MWPAPQPFCHGSKRDPGLLTRLLSRRQPRALTRHLCLEKGNFIWEIKRKAPFGPSKSVGAMGLIARRTEGDNLALGRPAFAPRPPSVSAHVAAGSVFRWRLGTRRRMELCPTILHGEFWLRHFKGRGGQRSTVLHLLLQLPRAGPAC